MPRGGGRYNWVSPGAAALEGFSGSLDQAMKERELLARQARADAIENARIERETTEAKARMAMLQEDQEFQRKDREDRIMRQKVADLGLMKGDVVPDELAPYVPHEIEQTIGGRALGGPTDIVPRATTNTSSLAVPQEAPATPATPGPVVPPAPAMIAQAPTGRKLFKGTVAERQADQKKAAISEVLKANPAFMQQPAVKTAMELMAKTGDMSYLDTVVQSLLKSKEPAAVGSFEDYLLQKFGPRPTAAQIEQARELYRLDQRFTPIVLQNYAGAAGGPAVFDPASRSVNAIGGAGPGAAGPGADGFLPADMDPRWKDVVLGTTSALEPTKRSQVLANVGRMVQQGNTAGVARELVNLVRANENAPVALEMDAREKLLATTADMRQLMTELQAAGIDTNIFRGSLERAVQFAGKTTDPRLAAFATRLDTALINYRRAVSGLAFSQQEGREYERVTPNIKNDMPLNLAKLDGLERATHVEEAAFWRSRLGDNADLVLAARAGRPTVPARTTPAGPGGPVSPNRAQELRRRLNP